MFTRCPACHTLFRIQPKQLKAARGQVRCGSCHAVFDGLDFLVNREELSKEELAALAKTSAAASRQWQLPFDDAAPLDESTAPSGEMAPPPQAPAAPSEPSTSSAEKPVTLEPDTPPATPTPVEVLEETIDTAATPDAPAESEQPPAAEQPMQPLRRSRRYSLARHEPTAAPARATSRLGWALASLLMLAVLAGQLTWFNRDNLARDLRWRPWLQWVCDTTTACQLPPLRDPHAIEMVDRNVQSHPHYQGALLITATLVNQAPFAQPYPEVELAMTDLDQKRVAARRFLPTEYLDNSLAPGVIPPGASVRLKLEITDPGQEAVGFEFEFY